MPSNRSFCLTLICVFFACALSAEAATVNATWNTAADVPVTAASYTATGNTVNFTLNFAPPTGTNLTVVNNTGLPFINGYFDNLPQGQAVALSYGGVTYNYVAHYYGGTGNDLVLVWANNRAFAWGGDGNGQVGDGAYSIRYIMVPVVATGVLAGKTIVALSQSPFRQSMALCSDGTVATWGYNFEGELGDNTTISRQAPVGVTTTSGVSALFGKTVVAVSAGSYHSMALCSDGTVATWGYNYNGQLGDNSTTQRIAPVAVNAATGASALFGKKVVAVAAGTYHSVALCSDGTVAAWGKNTNGQLGNNTTADSSVPVSVNAAPGVSALNGKTVVAVAAGYMHSMALCSDGTVATWGFNFNGQLGNSTTTDSRVPVAVNTASGVSALFGKTVVAVAAGSDSKYSLALCSDGTLAAWGYNYYGQLGNNTTTDSSSPVAVNTAQGISALAGKTAVAITGCGGNSCGAFCTDGTMVTWGNNTYGNLGNNSSINSPVPVVVNTSPLGSAESLILPYPAGSAAQSMVIVAEPVPTLATLAVTTVGGTSANLNGTVNANNGTASAIFEYGTSTAYGTSIAASPSTATGTANTAVSATPTGLTPGTTYHYRIKVAGFAGADQSFTTLNNNASLVGLVPSSGSLSPGFSPGTTQYTLSLGSLPNAITVTPTLADSNASVTVNNITVPSGSASGSIGLGYGDNVISIIVTAQDGVTKQLYTLGLTQGIPSNIPATYTSDSYAPVCSQGFTATGRTIDLALNYAPATGTNLMVVNNTGIGFISGTFSNLAQGQAVALSYGGVTYNYVATYYGGTGNDLVLVWANNRAFGWGNNSSGQIGDGTTNQRNLMVPVTAAGVLAGRTVVALSQGNNQSLALCSDGTVAAWGGNSYGQLGNNTTTSSTVPAAVNNAIGVSALSGKTVVAVAAGYSHSMALCSDGTVATWGSNSFGQLGNNTTTNSTVPVAVNATAGLSVLSGKTVVAIAAGFAHSMALCSDGTVATWGDCSYGQLGINQYSSSLVPVAVNTTSGISALSGRSVVAVAAGLYHSMALCSDGTVATWGDCSYGQLGINSNFPKMAPVMVNTASGVSALFGKTVVAVASGSSSYHSMALCSDGTLTTWGRNFYGQLGNNTTTDSNVPVVVNTAPGVSMLAGKTVVAITGCGSNSSGVFCADGTMFTWGYNTNGNLGNNSTTSSLKPVAVNTSPLGPAETLTVPYHGGTTSMSLALVAEPPPTLTGLAATAITSTAANLNGTANANNGTAAVTFDYGTTTAYGSSIAATPSTVTGSTATAVSATLTGLTPRTTYHYRLRSLTVTSADQTFTTANNDANLASLVTDTGTLSPAFTPGITQYTLNLSAGVNSISLTAASADSNASITINGTPVASGSTSGVIDLGYGTTVISIMVTAQDGVTKQVYTLNATRAIPNSILATYSTANYIPVGSYGFTAAGRTINLALNFAPATGTNLTVVNNTGTSFISGTFSNLTQGQAVALNYGGVTYNYVAHYYGGTGNDLVLVWAVNRAFAWGSNTYGRVGDGTTTQRKVMVPVTATGVLAGKTIVSLSHNYYHSLALCSDGTVAAWGLNAYGQLGNNTTTNSSVPVAVNTAIGVSALNGKTVVAVAAGYSHSMALCSDGAVVTWGYNASGQLGNNTTTNSLVPVAASTSYGTSALYGKTVVAVAAGYYHSLALRSDGTVVAWGLNTYGHLGNNTTTNSSVPVVVNTASGVSALNGKTVLSLTAGNSHSMALCSDGTVTAWGYNAYGQLGNNTTSNSSVPVAVNTADGASVLNGRTVTALAAGYNHSMALCSDGTVAAWGYNTYGQLGDNTNTSRSAPVAVNTTSGVSALYGKTVVAIGAGASGNASALCADGSMATWGDNGSGDLGNNSTTQSPVPVAVNTTPLVSGESLMPLSNSLSTPTSLALVAEPPGGATTLTANVISGSSAVFNGVVTPSNRLLNVFFDYGTSTAYDSSIAATPATAAGIIATAVSATATGLLPLTTYHYRVRAGSYVGADQTFTTPNNLASLAALTTSAGSLTPGFASGTTSYSAPDVPGEIGAITITPTLSDSNDAMAVTVNGVGVSAASGSASTVSLGYGTNVIQVVVTAEDGATTQNYSLSVTRPLPAAFTASYAAAGDVPLTSNAQIFPGSSTVNLALNYTPATGTNLMVINNTGTSFIHGTFSNLTQGQAVALSYGGQTYHYVANYYGGTGNDLVLVWANNRLMAWGTNLHGSLGDSTTTNRMLPTPVSAADVLAGKTITAMAMGNYHAVALCSDGTVAAWGSNGNGQLGINITNNGSSVPVAVNTSNGTSALYGKTVVAVAAGSSHSLALCSDGTVAAWGSNFYGELGNNSTISSPVPVLVNTSSGMSALYGKTVVAITAGDYISAALCSDGSVVTWGNNSNGELGNNSTIDSSVPVAVSTAFQVSALYGKTVIALAMGDSHTLALCTDGSLAAWGYNGSGQLGNNSTTRSSVPVAVNTASGVSALYGKTVTSLSASGDHNLVLCVDGSLAAWGYNNYGQLGNNSTTSSSVPQAVNTASGVSALYGKTVTAVSTGQYHCLALCSDGSATAWGSNSYGELGSNSTTGSRVPILVSNASMASGEQWCALSDGGTPIFWSMAVVAAPASPTITTQTATGIGSTSAILNGTVVAAYDSMTVSFEYGTSTSYGSAAAATSTPVSSGAATPVSAVITGLPPLTTYHFRVNGTNSSGTLSGSDQTFTTLNNNATLSSLTVSSGTLSPAFASGTTNYTVSVPYATSAISFAASLTDPNASMLFNGASITSGTCNLAEGENTITLMVTAQDGTTTQIYTLAVTRATGPSLASLGLSSGSLSPAFDSSTTNYSVNVDSTTSAITITPNVADSTSTVMVNGVGTISGNDSSPISLVYGNNAITIAVTSQDGSTTKTYVVRVTRSIPSSFSAAFASASSMPLTTYGLSPVGSSVSLTLNFAPVAGTSLTVVNNISTSFITGTFDNLAQGQMVALSYNGVNYHFIANYFGGTGNDLVLQWADTRGFAWGNNNSYQLGSFYGSSTNTPIPVTTSGSALNQKQITTFAAGSSHSLALCTDGTVAAWGFSFYGALGAGFFNYQSQTPVPVNTAPAGTQDTYYAPSALYGKSVAAISAGSTHSLALCTDGTLAAWGDNTYGQLGQHDYAYYLQPSVPAAVSTESGVSALAGKSVVSISAGTTHNLALCTDGTLVGWGNNTSGQLGNLSLTTTYYPQVVNTTNGVSALNGKTVVAISAGDSHSLALCTDGTVAAWGLNSSGQLGDNTTTNRTAPVAVNTASGVSALYGKVVVAICAGGSHSMALCSDGTLVAWGNNSVGQLGDNTITLHKTPVAVNKTSGTSALYNKTVTHIAAGSVHSMARCSDGTLATWGGNSYGQVAGATVGTSQKAPLAVPNGRTSNMAAAELFTLPVSGPNSTHSLSLVGTPPATATTLTATAVTSTSVVLNGQVNMKNGYATTSYDYGTTTAYGTNVSGSPASVGGIADTLTSVTLTGLQPATTYHFRANAGTYNGIDLTFTTLSQMQNWRQQFFGTTTNTGTGADTADYDGDGISNLMEFALNLSPLSISALPVTIVGNGANFEYYYSRSSAAVNAGTIFTVEWSDSLAAGSWSSAGVTQTVLSDDGTTQQVKAVIPVNAASAKFARLSVAAP